MTSPDPYKHLAGVYDELVVDPCHASWADHLSLHWSADHVHTVLDLCCGSGLMTAELLHRGYAVTGVDASPAMLARARNLLGPDADLRLAVLPDLPAGGPFDAAVSTLDGLNYLTLTAFSETMAAVADRLRPGGWLAFDVHAEGAIPFLQEHAVIHGSDGDADYTLTTSIDPVTRRCSSVLDYLAADPAAAFVEEHIQYIHTASDIRAALSAAGFTVVAVTDEYSDRPVSTDTLRATWMARRGGAS
ncbi:MAG: methyltransferase domain-containing protein [Actinomycetales bacterium]|nr:methyltransferase domain-containing protein [Actinomycetales bacterium]